MINSKYQNIRYNIDINYINKYHHHSGHILGIFLGLPFQRFFISVAGLHGLVFVRQKLELCEGGGAFFFETPGERWGCHWIMTVIGNVRGDINGYNFLSFFIIITTTYNYYNISESLVGMLMDIAWHNNNRSFCWIGYDIIIYILYIYMCIYLTNGTVVRIYWKIMVIKPTIIGIYWNTMVI